MLTGAAPLGVSFGRVRRIASVRSSRPCPFVAPPSPPQPPLLPLLLQILDLPLHQFRVLLSRTSSWHSLDSASATAPPSQGTRHKSARGGGPVKRERGAIRMGLAHRTITTSGLSGQANPTKKFGTLARFQNTIFFKTPLFSRVVCQLLDSDS